MNEAEQKLAEVQMIAGYEAARQRHNLRIKALGFTCPHCEVKPTWESLTEDERNNWARAYFGIYS